MHLLKYTGCFYFNWRYSQTCVTWSISRKAAKFCTRTVHDMGKRNLWKKNSKVTDQRICRFLHFETAKILLKTCEKNCKIQYPNYIIDNSANIWVLKKKRRIDNHSKYQLICKMNLTLAQRALLVKLFYLIESSKCNGLFLWN